MEFIDFMAFNVNLVLFLFIAIVLVDFIINVLEQRYGKTVRLQATIWLNKLKILTQNLDALSVGEHQLSIRKNLQTISTTENCHKSFKGAKNFALPSRLMREILEEEKEEKEKKRYVAPDSSDSLEIFSLIGLDSKEETLHDNSGLSLKVYSSHFIEETISKEADEEEETKSSEKVVHRRRLFYYNTSETSRVQRCHNFSTLGQPGKELDYDKSKWFTSKHLERANRSSLQIQSLDLDYGLKLDVSIESDELVGDNSSGICTLHVSTRGKDYFRVRFDTAEGLFQDESSCDTIQTDEKCSTTKEENRVRRL